MKLKIATVLYLLTIFVSLNAQNKNYTFVIQKGTGNYIYDEPNAVTILDESVNKKNVLSDWQLLPFDWDFYGKQVEGYFISDNGYITFDSEATISEPINNNIPSSDNVNNAIYAVWDDWNMYSYVWTGDKIKTITLGTAPNRVHIIQWVGVTHAAKDNPNGWGFFAIRLYEGGDFDIVHEGFNGVAALNSSVTVGVENEDGSIATKVMGPDDMVAFASNSKNTDGNIFTFKWEIQATNDLSFDNVLIPREVSLGNYHLSGTITNLGFNEVTSFEVNYRINETIISSTIKDISVLPYESYIFTTNNSYAISKPGLFYNVEAWTTNVNGEIDENSSNNKPLTGKFFSINGNSAIPKQVLLEETTGVWCSPCITGIMEIDTIALVLGDDVNIVAFHGGNDPMANTQSKSFASTYKASFPNGFIDRELFDVRGEKTLNIINSIVNHTWLNLTQNQLSNWTPLNISFNEDSKYNSNTREINAKIDVEFSDYAIPGDLRIVLYVVEDNVTEIGNSKYSQKNPISGNSRYSWHPFYFLPDPIPNFTFKHVFRGSPNMLGNKGIIENINKPGDSYSETLNIKLDENWDSDSITLVTFVYYYDLEKDKRHVLNSTSIQLKDLNRTNINTNLASKGTLSVYPNPSFTKQITLNYTLNVADEISIVILDQLGKIVFLNDKGLLQAGNQNIPLNLRTLSKGIYNVIISGKKQKQLSSKFILIE